jgi:endonuclease YncB( thermonuclease family)
MARARTVVTFSVVAAVAITAGAVWLARSGPRPDEPSAVGTASSQTASAPASVTPVSPSPTRPGGSPSDPGPAPVRPAGAFPMTVKYVYDGDTLQLQHTTPNSVVTTTNPIRVRLIGIDTPEASPKAECWSREATAALRAVAPVGATVWAAPDRESWDPYGRRLFSLWTDDGRFVEGQLVAAGAAKAIRVWPNVANHAYLSAVEGQAAAAGAGQWGAC